MFIRQNVWVCPDPLSHLDMKCTLLFSVVFVTGVYNVSIGMITPISIALFARYAANNGMKTQLVIVQYNIITCTMQNDTRAKSMHKSLNGNSKTVTVLLTSNV